jgi:hypothetical protein
MSQKEVIHNSNLTCLCTLYVPLLVLHSRTPVLLLSYLLALQAVQRIFSMYLIFRTEVEGYVQQQNCEVLTLSESTTKSKCNTRIDTRHMKKRGKFMMNSVGLELSNIKKKYEYTHARAHACMHTYEYIYMKCSVTYWPNFRNIFYRSFGAKMPNKI